MKKTQPAEHRRSGRRGDMPSAVRKTGSIARGIAWSFHWRKLVRAVFIPLFLGLAAVAGWCCAADNAAFGAVTGSGEGWAAFLGELPRAWSAVFEVRAAGGDIAALAVITPGGQSVFAGEFLFGLGILMGGLMALGVLDWLFSYAGVIRRVRRYLKPIDDIAQVTESISSKGFDESKFHSIEEAIDHINGVSADEQLHIGDDDLAGLETAVNNLILRLHSSYRRQVRFVDDAGHELRTPIAVIQGYADMLDRWGKKDEQVLDEAIRAIRTETEHMKTLVEQLLFLARGDAGRQELKLEPLDLRVIAREVAEESRMIDTCHTYILKGEEEVTVRGDEAMLKQAVRILMENAAKYSPEDSRITLRTYREGAYACLDVQDNGIGVSAGDARRMFDRFYRSDAARNSETGGSGLGLSIARWIVGCHGGGFRVKSYENIGTRITIELPLQQE